ncbi:MAG TPA: choice-of-anchor V domain-containing protein [Pyrinomonadaceae bacterium]
MKSKTKKIKILCILVFAGLAVFGLANSNRFGNKSFAASTGPEPAHTGAPGETTCGECHAPEVGGGQFTINAPANYTPGQTYQITVQHQTNDSSRARWGFQLTALAGVTPTVNFANLNGSTQIINGNGGRKYIEHTLPGTFGGQQGGASWTFNWTAPATNVGAIKLYAAGNQANNDGTNSGDQIYVTNVTIQPPVVAQSRPTAFDFDGDHKSDISIFRPGPGEWWYARSSDGQIPAAQFGNSADKITPGDFTGDGKTDIALWRPSDGNWFILRSENGSFFSFPFGTAGDIPAPADYDNDGKADAAVFRPSTGTWFILNSGGSGTSIVNFGTSEDKPVAADYDGDGKADIAIFRPSDGSWWYLRSTDNQFRVFRFGVSTDKPVQGDYTGDGKADIAVWRPATGEWFVQRSEDNSFYSVPFGASGDVPAPGDYDGDGKLDTAVFRPSSATWFVQRTTAGTLIAGFGIGTDLPVPAAFIP